MQNNTSISLDGLGTLWRVLDIEKRIKLQSELQQVVDKWHRQELQTILNTALVMQQMQLQSQQPERKEMPTSEQ